MTAFWNPAYLLAALLLAAAGGVGVLVQAQRVRDSLESGVHGFVGGIGLGALLWALFALGLLAHPGDGTYRAGPLGVAALTAIVASVIAFRAVQRMSDEPTRGRAIFAATALTAGLFAMATLTSLAFGDARPASGTVAWMAPVLVLAGVSGWGMVWLLRHAGRGVLAAPGAQLLAGLAAGGSPLLVFVVALWPLTMPDTVAGGVSLAQLAAVVALVAMLLLGAGSLYSLYDRSTALANRQALVGLVEAHAGLERRAEALARASNEELRRARDALSAEKQLAEVTLEAMVEGVVRVNNLGRIRYANAAAGVLSGVEPRALLGQFIGDVMLIQDDRAANRGNALALFAVDGPCCLAMGDLMLIRPGGIRVSVEVRISPYHSDESGEGGRVYAIRDTTAERNSRRNLVWQAEHDALTGLKNRRAFEIELKRALAGHEVAALAFLDLDRFKSVNDQLGHQAGDELLVGIAQALRERLRERDLIARLGGDEFAILLHGCPIDEAVRVMQDMVVAVGRVCEPFAVVDARLGVSIGVTGLQPGMTPEDATQRADAACYDAKNAGRNQVARYREPVVGSDAA